VFCIIVIAIINILQTKAPHRLPTFLQSWEWAPIWLRSLEPYDRIIQKLISFVRQHFCCFKKEEDADEAEEKPERYRAYSEENGRVNGGHVENPTLTV
jgi:hypothetical protein